MKISKFFILISFFFLFTNVLFAQNEKIPDSEYLALQELFDNSAGFNWTNNTNWLDTINSTVNDWFGITVENGHVTKVELDNNNLQEVIFSNRVNLPELTLLDLRDNLIDEANFGNLDSLKNLIELKVENNRFTFKSLENIFFSPIFNNISGNFTYVPQAKIGQSYTKELDEGEPTEIEVESYYFTGNDKFQWYKNNEAIPGANKFWYEFPNVSAQDAGNYYLKVTNPNVPELTIQSQNIEVIVNSGKEIPDSEYNALVAFYNALDGDNWTNNSNWLNSSISINDWYGVTVEEGHVTRIEFSENYLSGFIPAEIENLNRLQIFTLFKNNISDIPPEIGNLNSLQNLSFRLCNISGTIPNTIGNLSNLHSLSFENNNISGSIPKEIGNLSNLEYLCLMSNDLSGSIPKEIGKLNKLQTLILNFNSISGVLPSEIGDLSELKTFIINHNSIEGPLPAEMSKLKNLETLHINANWIGRIIDENIPREAKQIPNVLEEMSSLKYLRIGQNYLLFNDIEPIYSWQNYNNLNEFKYELQTGLHKNIEIMSEKGENVNITIPNYIPSPSDTYEWKKDYKTIPGANNSTLELTNVQLEDEGFYYCTIRNNVASEISIFVYSTTLRVNDIHGAGVPFSEYNALVDFFNSNGGENWIKKENWLDTINFTVAEWEGIEVMEGHVFEINMDTNNVSGAFPTALYNLNELIHVNFYMNQISGSLPEDIDKLSKLTSLCLSDNSITGNIPESIGNIENLQFLFLNNNNFEGSIPSSLGKLNNLYVLELNNNNLSGTIPASLGNLSNLSELNLASNKLIGPIPVELQNLTKVYRIKIENNLIGTIQNEKSAKTSLKFSHNNRQIPDELADLIALDTFNIGSNGLQFNDIEAIFSWDNFSDFKDFVYAPQDKIGIEKTIKAEENKAIEIIIDNYYPGQSDRFQWYKNGTKITGATSAKLEFAEVKLEDAGEYYCKVSNSVARDLILQSNKIRLNVSKKEVSAGVSLDEYNALVEIYNATNGNDWINNTNWLDTINYSVADWFGITVKDGHVTEFLMPENGLSKIPNDLNQLSFLEKIDLSSGNFEGEIPDFSTLDKLTEFSIANNKYIFNDLLPITNWENFDTFKENFNYSPQAKTGTAKTNKLSINEEINIEIDNYPETDSDSFSWFKNEKLLNNETNSNFKKQAWYDDMNAIFYCEITNVNLPELTLVSEEILIEVLHNTNDSLTLVGLRNDYDFLKEIWTSDSVFTWPHITVENGCVIAIDFSGLGLDGVISQFFSQFDSLSWLNLSNNNLSGAIPFFSNNKSSTAEIQLEYLNISNNNFGFSDLEANKNQLNAIGEFIYAPQFQDVINIDTIVYKYDSIIFETNNVIPGEYDIYAWGKDGSTLNGENQITCSLENIQLQDSGTYVCTITNSLFPDLTFSSNIYNLKVLIPVGIEENKLSFQVYPNPASDKVYVDTQHKKVELKIYSITGKLIIEKTDFTSDWINIEDFKKGIYLFQLKSKTDQTWTKKLVFR